MPHLRFTRDQRGYENTFLVHTTRRRGRERSRVLYWFRSPPHVKIGRSALDEEAIRAIEEGYPEIAFEWPRILAARPPVPGRQDDVRSSRGRSRDRDAGRGVPASQPVRPVTAAELPDVGNRPMQAEPSAPARFLPDVQLAEPAQPSRAVRVPVSAVSEEGDVDALDVTPSTLEPPAAERALGSEGLSLLRARYAEVLARISSQVSDGARADELRQMAERLNPDAWVTAGDVRTGLNEFEPVLEEIRRQLGPLRRRPRRGGFRSRHPEARPEASVEAPGVAPDRTVEEGDLE